MVAKQEDPVMLFTDGACRGNPGPGGWGVVMRYRGRQKLLSGAVGHTTNNRMELQAAISGLGALTRPCRVEITTDSQYVKNGIEQWLSTWKRKHWRTSGKTPVKNQDLWQQLDALVQCHDVTWHWVRGHNGHPENELADSLAREAIDSL